MATSSRTYTDDMKLVWDVEFSDVVASSLITITLAAPGANLFWCLKSVQGTTDVAGSFQVESPAATVINKIGIPAAGVLDEQFPVDTEHFRPNGYSGANNQALVCKLAVTTAGQLNLIAVKLPLLTFNSGGGNPTP